MNHAPTQNEQCDMTLINTIAIQSAFRRGESRIRPDDCHAGAYFVTVCTQDRECLFGHVVNGEMRLNDAGETARRCWEGIPHHFTNVVLDALAIMPNHVHGVIVITDAPQATRAVDTKSRRGERFFAPTRVNVIGPRRGCRGMMSIRPAAPLLRLAHWLTGTARPSAPPRGPTRTRSPGRCPAWFR